VTITNLEGVKQLATKLRNWERWGTDDELGTVNFITAETIVGATKLVKRGKSFALGIGISKSGPQRLDPLTSRFNPIHLMVRTGTDAAAGAPSNRAFTRTSDDVIIIGTHTATHWDALSHVFYEGKMWNGYDCALVTGTGATKNGIEKYKGKLLGRGILLDVARHKQVKSLEPGFGITPDDLDECALWEGVRIERGDFILIRTGQMRQVKERGYWGDYAGGDAPGLTIETAEWIHKMEVAAVASDTWGAEVRPNATPDCYMPWHVIVIPNIGLLVGEIFDLEELGEDCVNDGIYEFMFVAPITPIVGAVASPIDPIAVK
jgi:kynurenine formamidase